MLLAIRVRSKDKISSRCSTGKLVRVSFPAPLRAQQQYERATHSRFPFTNVMGRVRVCLTLMPGQSANADCRRAPGRHLWSTNVIPGGPFATRAHASGVADNRMVFAHSNRLCWRMISGAVSGMNGTRKLAPAAAGRWFASLKTTNYNKWRTVVARPVRLFGFQLSVFQHFPVGFTEPTLALRAKYRHGSARARD